MKNYNVIIHRGEEKQALYVQAKTELSAVRKAKKIYNIKKDWKIIMVKEII